MLWRQLYFLFTFCERQIPALYDHYCYEGFLWNTARNKPLSKGRKQNTVRLSSGEGGIKGSADQQ